MKFHAGTKLSVESEFCPKLTVMLQQQIKYVLVVPNERIQAEQMSGLILTYAMRLTLSAVSDQSNQHKISCIITHLMLQTKRVNTYENLDFVALKSVR